MALIYKTFIKSIPGYQGDKMNLCIHSNNYFLFLISKSLRKENPIKTYHDLSASEEREIANDLQVCIIFLHSLHMVFFVSTDLEVKNEGQFLIDFFPDS